MMLKELFKFHSKEEDFRVKCLILILLGIALIINSANAWTQLDTFNDASGTDRAQPTFFLKILNNSAFVPSVTWLHYEVSAFRYTAPDEWEYNGYLTVSGNYSCIAANIDVTSSHSAYLGTADAVTDIYFDWVDPQPPCASGATVFKLNGSTQDGLWSNRYGFWYHDVYPSGVTEPYGFGLESTRSPGKYIATVYGGADLPDPPVITDFTKDKSCYYPYEGIILESDVTGDVDSWTWEIYDQEDQLIDSSSDAVETILGPLNEVGMYNVQLTVENTGGSDFLLKEDFVNVTISGTCTGIGNWTPFPTVPTVTPTSVVYPTMTVPPVPFINKSGINDMVNESMWGNYSAAYRKYIDEVGDSVNQTVTGATGLVMTPFAFIVQGIAVVLDLFSTSLASLMVYTTVPLSITSRVINVMPWQMQSIITAGLAIDAIFLLVLGKG